MEAGTFKFRNLQHRWTEMMATGTEPTRDETIEKPSDKEPSKPVKEIGGPKGLEPTRYGDWERKGIVSDF
jgi:hypothetical protein